MTTPADAIEGAIEEAVEEHRLTGHMWTAGDLCGAIGEALHAAGFEIVDRQRPPRRPPIGR